MIRLHVLLYFIGILFIICSVNGDIEFTAIPSESLSATITCPLPLIKDPNPLIKKLPCFEGCCLPCPFVNNFYPENKIDNIYYALSVFRVISFIVILIIVLSYIVLPNKREHPAVTVLCFNFSLLVFMGITFFYIGDHKRIQCYDSVTQASISNNYLCGIQGIILIFTTFTLILYCFLLILHLHFQTVWHSNIIQRYYPIFQILVLLISTIFTLLPAITKQILFEFGAVCLVASQTSQSYFWTPLAVFVLSGFIIHVWTFIYIAKSQCMFFEQDFEETIYGSSELSTGITKKDIVNAIRIQWRALMLAVIFLLTFTFFWIYMFIVIRKLSYFVSHEGDYQFPAWTDQWKSCIINASSLAINAQDHCYSVSKPHLPNVSLIIVAEFLTSILGISIFIVFGTSINFWNEWKIWFQNRFSHVGESKSQKSEKSHGEYQPSWV